MVGVTTRCCAIRCLAWLRQVGSAVDAANTHCGKQIAMISKMAENDRPLTTAKEFKIRIFSIIRRPSIRYPALHTTIENKRRGCLSIRYIHPCGSLKSLCHLTNAQRIKSANTYIENTYGFQLLNTLSDTFTHARKSIHWHCDQRLVRTQ